MLVLNRAGSVLSRVFSAPSFSMPPTLDRAVSRGAEFSTIQRGATQDQNLLRASAVRSSSEQATVSRGIGNEPSAIQRRAAQDQDFPLAAPLSNTPQAMVSRSSGNEQTPIQRRTAPEAPSNNIQTPIQRRATQNQDFPLALPPSNTPQATASHDSGNQQTPIQRRTAQDQDFSRTSAGESSRGQVAGSRGSGPAPTPIQRSAAQDQNFSPGSVGELSRGQPMISMPVVQLLQRSPIERAMNPLAMTLLQRADMPISNGPIAAPATNLIARNASLTQNAHAQDVQHQSSEHGSFDRIASQLDTGGIDALRQPATDTMLEGSTGREVAFRPLVMSGQINRSWLARKINPLAEMVLNREAVTSTTGSAMNMATPSNAPRLSVRASTALVNRQRSQSSSARLTESARSSISGIQGTNPLLVAAGRTGENWIHRKASPIAGALHDRMVSREYSSVWANATVQKSSDLPQGALPLASERPVVQAKRFESAGALPFGDAMVPHQDQPGSASVRSPEVSLAPFAVSRSASTFPAEGQMIQRSLVRIGHSERNWLARKTDPLFALMLSRSISSAEETPPAPFYRASQSADSQPITLPIAAQTVVQRAALRDTESFLPLPLSNSPDGATMIQQTPSVERGQALPGTDHTVIYAGRSAESFVQRKLNPLPPVVVSRTQAPQAAAATDRAVPTVQPIVARSAADGALEQPTSALGQPLRSGTVIRRVAAESTSEPGTLPLANPNAHILARKVESGESDLPLVGESAPPAVIERYMMRQAESPVINRSIVTPTLIQRIENGGDSNLGGANGGVDEEALIEKIMRRLMRNLTIEQERRGGNRWP
jgi:hypothetical protein